MSSGKRSLRGQVDDGEFFLECKASFLSVFDDITDKIGSRRDLITDELSFNDFVDICRKEPATTTDDLMKAFRKIDINGDGYISLDELCKIMTKKGESMSRDEVKDMITEVDDNDDGRLDYREFSNMIMKTTNECKKMSLKVMERKERRKKRTERRNSGTNGVANAQQKTDSPKSLSVSTKSPKLRPESETPKYHPKSDTPKSKTGTKTPRSTTDVEEDIEFNDDFDIISTGRPTPRIDLYAGPDTDYAKKDEWKADHFNKGVKQNDAEPTLLTKEGKGILASAFGLASGSGSDAHGKESTGSGAQSHDREGQYRENIEAVEHPKPKLYETEKGKHEKMGENKGEKEAPDTAWSSVIDDIFRRKTDVEKTGDIKGDDKHEVKGSKHEEKAVPDSARSVIDEIFRPSARSEKSFTSGFGVITQQAESAHRVQTYKEEGSVSANVESKPPQGRSLETTSKDKVHPPTAAPRKDVTVTFAKDTVQTGTQKSTYQADMDSQKLVAKQNENGYSSPDVKGDKDLTPVPSPRKRVMEDDFKPSPRPRKTEKGKSPVTKREKLPDARTLRAIPFFRNGNLFKFENYRQTVEILMRRLVTSRLTVSSASALFATVVSEEDWSHSTSKGCFFYEDGEIVTHIYSLKLSEDSTVYLSTHPVQEPACLSLKGDEPIDTALFVLDSRGKLVTFTEQRDIHGTYGVKCELSAGEYQLLPYTTGCRFKQKSEEQHTKEAKLVKKDKDNKIVITSAFRKALEDIFELCDLDDNGTMSKDEFNWFNLRTSGEELGQDEWDVVEERTVLENGEITKKGFIELNEMEAEDSDGDIGDLWITLTSMGLNKALIMDEASPYRVDVYVEETGRRSPKLRCTGIESLEKKEFLTEVCNSVVDMSTGEPVKVRGMKDLYHYTYRNEHRATIVLDNKSRSMVRVEIDCKGCRNAVSNRSSLAHTVEVEPQSMAIAHHLLPRSETSDWSITCSETIHK